MTFTIYSLTARSIPVPSIPRLRTHPQSACASSAPGSPSNNPGLPLFPSLPPFLMSSPCRQSATSSLRGKALYDQSAFVCVIQNSVNCLPAIFATLLNISALLRQFRVTPEDEQQFYTGSLTGSCYGLQLQLSQRPESVRRLCAVVGPRFPSSLGS